MTRQELKHDEVLDFGERAVGWVNRHSALISTIIIILTLAFVGYKGYKWYEYNQAAKANAELSSVFMNYNGAMEQEDESKRMEMLGAAAAEAERVAGEYDVETGEIALLQAGNAKYMMAVVSATSSTEAQKYLEAARDSYRKFIAEVDDPRERAIGYLGLGQTLENLMFMTESSSVRKEAADAYNEAIRLAPDSYIAAEAKLSQARMLQAQEGRQDEARKLYQEVIENRGRKAKATRPVATEEESEFVTPPGENAEAVEELRSLEQFTYAGRAKRALSVLEGLPTARPGTQEQEPAP